MTLPLLAPPDLTPSVPPDATPQQCMAMWLDLMEACDQFVLAALRREIGPDGDLRAAWKRWDAEQREEHDRAMAQMVERFNRVGGGHGR